MPTVCCFPNLEPGAISRFLDSLKVVLDAYKHCRKFAGIRVDKNILRNVWVREYSKNGKYHFHIFLFFNKDDFYHLGHLKHSSTLSNLIVKAWYSALRLELEDCHEIVHFPDNCRYVLNINDPDFDIIYNELLEQLDYLTKLDTKVFGEGDRSLECSRG